MDSGIIAYGEIRKRMRNHLPHFDTDRGIYFVTFCLADAIGPAYLYRLRERMDARLDEIRKSTGTVTVADQLLVERERRQELFEEMDRGRGECALANPTIGKLVSDALTFFDGKRYRLVSQSVMPNHVHVVYRPFAGIPWWRVTGSWKSFTAKEANRLRGRTGRFWQDDSYERLLRSESELTNAVRYVVDNPRRAGLGESPWTKQLLFPPYANL